MISETRSRNTASRPGYKTTEFWLSLLAMLLSYVMASGITEGMDNTHIVMRVIAAASVILGAIGYTVGRSMVKKVL